MARTAQVYRVSTQATTTMPVGQAFDLVRRDPDYTIVGVGVPTNTEETVDQALDRRIDEAISDVTALGILPGAVNATRNTKRLKAAIASGRRHFYFPEGNYWFNDTIRFPGGSTVRGAGRRLTTVHYERTTFPNSDSYYLFIFDRYTTGADDRSESTFEHMAIKGDGRTAKVYGHGMLLQHLSIFNDGTPNIDNGADPNYEHLDNYAIQMIDANECMIANILFGDDPTSDNDHTCSAIVWHAVKPAVNYGDSIISNCSIRLDATETCGLWLKGAAPQLVNNILVNRMQVIAPASGITPHADSVGLILESVARTTLLVVDTEACATGYIERSTVSSAGACLANTYIGCQAINCTVPYVDSNATVANSVQRRTFLGCDGLQWGSEAAANSIKRGDAMVGRGMWFNAHNTNQPGPVLRATTADALAVSDYSMVSGDATWRGLKFVVPASGNSRIECGDGINQVASRRMYLGNPSWNKLRDITIDSCPLRWTEMTAEHPSITDGCVVYADGVTWNPGSGSGLYLRDNGTWNFLGGAGQV